MANLLDQIGQRNVVRVISNGVPSSLESLTDTDFSQIEDGSVPVWNAQKQIFTSFGPEEAKQEVSSIMLTVNPETNNTTWTDTIDCGFF